MELQKIGVTPATGWDSGAGAVTVLSRAPKREAINTSLERQLWVQHAGTQPLLEGFTAAGGMYRAEFHVWIMCPQPVSGEDMVSKLERDVRRAVQLGESTLQGSALATAGIAEGTFEVHTELAEAGIAAGRVQIFADYIKTKGDP